MLCRGFSCLNWHASSPSVPLSAFVCPSVRQHQSYGRLTPEVQPADSSSPSPSLSPELSLVIEAAAPTARGSPGSVPSPTPPPLPPLTTTLVQAPFRLVWITSS